MGNGAGNRQKAEAVAGFSDGTLRCVARWQAGDLHYRGRFRTRSAVGRRHRRKFFTAPPVRAGLYTSAFLPGWQHLLCRSPSRRYVSADDQSGWHGLASNHSGSSGLSLRYFAGRQVGGGVGRGGCKCISLRRGDGHSGMYRLCIRWCREPWSDAAIDQLVARWQGSLFVF